MSVDDKARVTGTRYISQKISQSRNEVGNIASSVDGNICHHCREPFASGQVRYPIMDGVLHNDGWGLVSICKECFEGDWWVDRHPEYAPGQHLSQGSYLTLDRFERRCAGCGEPIMTNTDYRRFKWQVCSARCYQRIMRKQRHQDQQCQACKKWFKPSRKDARYCSNACRQWTYRRRP